MYIEILILLLGLCGGALFLTQFINNKYLFIILTGILFLISGLGTLGGIDIPNGEIQDYGVGYVQATTQNVTVTQTRTTIDNNNTFIIGSCFVGLALYLILISPFATTEGDVINNGRITDNV